MFGGWICSFFRNESGDTRMYLFKVTESVQACSVEKVEVLVDLFPIRDTNRKKNRLSGFHKFDLPIDILVDVCNVGNVQTL